MPQPLPEEEQRLESYAALVEAIAAMDNPTKSDVLRVLEGLRTGNPRIDREMSGYADVLHLLALSKPHLLSDFQRSGRPAALDEYAATHGLDLPKGRDLRRAGGSEDA